MNYSAKDDDSDLNFNRWSLKFKNESLLKNYKNFTTKYLCDERSYFSLLMHVFLLSICIDSSMKVNYEYILNIFVIIALWVSLILSVILKIFAKKFQKDKVQHKLVYLRKNIYFLI